MTLVCRFLHLALVAATATFLSCGAPSQESPDLSVEDSNVSNDTDASGFDTWDTLPDMASDTMVDVPLDGFDMADESDSTNGLVLPPLGFESGKFEFEVKEMDNTVSELVQAWIDGGQEAVEDYADEHDIQLWNGDLQLMIRHPERDGELLVSVEDLVAAGGEVLDTYDDTTWMAVPLAGLYELTMTVEIGLMDNIWIPLTPVVEPLSNNLDPMMIPDWALEATGMLSCLEAGVQGAGVKIAILDSGFLFATKMVEEGLLPEGTNVMYPSDGLPADWVESPHGSAVAQIVHRSAPGARLVLLTVPNTEVSLNKAVEWCIQNDVDVINASWGRYNQSFYDGQGPVSAAARKAWDNGIVWVSASGNLGSGKSWRGGWTDQDDDGLLDFAPGENFNEFTLKEGESARVFLTWDKWPSTTMSSLTLCLEAKGYPEGHPDDITTQIKCAPAPKFGKSPATQLMMKRTEDLCHEEPDKYYCTTDDFRLAVQATGVMGNMLKPDEGVGISLLVSSNASGFHLEHSTSAGSLADPACQEDIITVGAVHEEDWAQGIVAPYSSHGPTNGGIQKPELVGPSGVFVAFSPSAKGTSFSAPYVTAAAALILEKAPGLTPDEVKQLLIDQAEGVAANLPAVDSGYGKLKLDCCELNCLYRECGDDGCGGTCGTCATGTHCLNDIVCVAEGEDCPGGCDDANACSQDICLANQSCIHLSEPDGTPCKDVGSWGCEDGYCTCTTNCGTKQCGNDGCGGSCGNCDDGIDCTLDMCQLASGACSNLADDGACDDENACTVDRCEGDTGCIHEDVSDLCDDGVGCTYDFCEPLAGCSSAVEDLACDDDDPCTEDLCDLTMDCQHVPMVDGTPCTTSLVCVGGLCNCEPQCTGKECGDDGCGGSCGVCDDLDMCTDGDQCVDGLCVPGESLDCDDGDPCTDDTCDPTDGCSTTFNTASCEDGDGCTENDVCSEGVCAGEAIVPCECSADEDCLNLENGDTCDGLLRCVDHLCEIDPETVVVCPPASEPCVQVACDPTNGQCVESAAPNGAACAVAHAGQASCDDGACVLEACEAGWADCDPEVAGCETETDRDPLHCGGCNQPCAVGGAFDHANAGCLGGECWFLGCDPGFADGDADCEENVQPCTNGCEACEPVADGTVEIPDDGKDNDCSGGDATHSPDRGYYVDPTFPFGGGCPTGIGTPDCPFDSLLSAVVEALIVQDWEGVEPPKRELYLAGGTYDSGTMPPSLTRPLMLLGGYVRDGSLWSRDPESNPTILSQTGTIAVTGTQEGEGWIVLDGLEIYGELQFGGDVVLHRVHQWKSSTAQTDSFRGTTTSTTLWLEDSTLEGHIYASIDKSYYGYGSSNWVLNNSTIDGDAGVGRSSANWRWNGTTLTGRPMFGTSCPNWVFINSHIGATPPALPSYPVGLTFAAENYCTGWLMMGSTFEGTCSGKPGWRAFGNHFKSSANGIGRAIGNVVGTVDGAWNSTYLSTYGAEGRYNVVYGSVTSANGGNFYHNVIHNNYVFGSSGAIVEDNGIYGDIVFQSNRNGGTFQRNTVHGEVSGSTSSHIFTNNHLLGGISSGGSTWTLKGNIIAGGIAVSGNLGRWEVVNNTIFLDGEHDAALQLAGAGWFVANNAFVWTGLQQLPHVALLQGDASYAPSALLNNAFIGFGGEGGVFYEVSGGSQYTNVSYMEAFVTASCGNEDNLVFDDAEAAGFVTTDTDLPQFLKLDSQSPLAEAGMSLPVTCGSYTVQPFDTDIDGEAMPCSVLPIGADDSCQ